MIPLGKVAKGWHCLAQKSNSSFSVFAVNQLSKYTLEASWDKIQVRLRRHNIYVRWIFIFTDIHSFNVIHYEFTCSYNDGHFFTFTIIFALQFKLCKISCALLLKFTTFCQQFISYVITLPPIVLKNLSLYVDITICMVTTKTLFFFNHTINS